MPTAIDTETAQTMLAGGSPFVEVLPEKHYAQEHLPGAISIPLADITRAGDTLDPRRPVVVYCFDYQ